MIRRRSGSVVVQSQHSFTYLPIKERLLAVEKGGGRTHVVEVELDRVADARLGRVRTVGYPMLTDVDFECLRGGLCEKGRRCDQFYEEPHDGIS